ncbi:MAG: transketolase family protein [Candidatus Omnitrophica bacterium]|nr:transketolase family protein [Candidatus Omnitrophota bacterium]MBU1932989.1 transketolase family protein [Candidatus Omnitrophota bacterium]
MEKKPTRDGFGEGVVELGAKRQDIVVLSADLTDSTRAGWFKKKFPERFFSMGVSEQDMISTAAGFALAGKRPFACTFGVFAAGRAWDQIRVSVAYMNLNVVIIGTHGGISVGPDGPTHQAIEEITLMRALPNMTVLVPCDAIEAKKATIASASHNGPVYIRLGRSGAPVITKPDDSFTMGRANVLKQGKDVAIIACGCEVYEALLAHDILKKEGIESRIVNLHTIKPIDEELIIKAARDTGAIVTAEEHTVMGGMGSAVSEVLSREYPVPVEFIGVKDRFGESGDPAELFKIFELTADDIVKAAKRVIERKKKE